MADVDTFTHAETIVSAISNELIGKDVFELHNLIANSNAGINFVTLDGRFNNSVDREAIKDYLLDQISSHPVVKTWVTRAVLQTHLCSHDNQDVQDCKTTQWWEWSR